jgi:hypothetical protein
LRLQHDSVAGEAAIRAVVGPHDDVSLRCGHCARPVGRAIVGSAGACGDHPVVRLRDGAWPVRRAVVRPRDRSVGTGCPGDDERDRRKQFPRWRASVLTWISTYL